MTAEPVRIEVTLPRPIAEVWPAFRDPALIRRWHGWDYDDLDAEIQEIFIDGTIASEDDRTLHIGGHLFALEARGPQTVVRVTRATPLDTASMDWNAWYDDIDEGWLSFLQQLRFALTHHWGEERHTVHLGGETLASSPKAVADALGLGDTGALAAGERYAAVVAGEQLEGEVWFRSPHQLGLTVDAWGPGLLLLAEAPNPPVPHGAATATLTTYGDDDDRTRAASWRTLWAAHYGDKAS